MSEGEEQLVAGHIVAGGRPILLAAAAVLTAMAPWQCVSLSLLSAVVTRPANVFFACRRCLRRYKLLSCLGRPAVITMSAAAGRPVPRWG